MIMTTYAQPADQPQALTPRVTARLQPSLGIYTPPNEIVQLWYAGQLVGIATVPRQAAHDLVTRLEDAPARLGVLTPEIVGHVRHQLDSTHTAEVDRPTAWISCLIMLIQDATEEQRRQIGLSYAAYTAAVRIATASGGLDELRHLHETLLAADQRTAAGG